MTNWAFLIGVSNYDKHDIYLPLDFCDSDIKEIEKILKKEGNYNVNCYTSDDNANSPKLTRLLGDFNSFVNKIAPRDKVIFYFEGHGGSHDGKNYIFPQDAQYDYKNDIPLFKSFLSINDLIDDLINVGAENCDVFFIIDACREKLGQKSMGKMSFNEKFEIKAFTNDIFLQLPSGISMLFSCTEDQKAYSFNENGQIYSIFSYTFLKALQGNVKPPITFGKVVEYLKIMVPKIAQEQNKPSQNPREKMSLEGRDKVILGPERIYNISDFEVSYEKFEKNIPSQFLNEFKKFKLDHFNGPSLIKNSEGTIYVDVFVFFQGRGLYIWLINEISESYQLKTIEDAIIKITEFKHIVIINSNIDDIAILNIKNYFQRKNQDFIFGINDINKFREFLTNYFGVPNNGN